MQMSKKGTFYFFTGLAGAGKTTIGGRFYEHLQAQRPGAVLIDGDRSRAESVRAKDPNARTGDGSDDERYTTEARRAGAKDIFYRCRALTEAGTDVVYCGIAMYAELREWNRANIENYREIYIRVKRETLYARNQKGLYSPGRKNVVGVDLPWDEPDHPDVVIQNDGGEPPEEIVARLLERFGLEAAG